MDARYLNAGSELRVVAERHTTPVPGRQAAVASAGGVTVDAGCSAIATAILLASRQAASTP